MTTSLYGKLKYGAFQYGPTDIITNPRFGLEMDWNGDGVYDGDNEGINLQGLSIEHGRKYTISAEGDSFEVQETGRMSAILLDEFRRYDPYNESSPLFGMLTGGKYFRIRVRTASGSIYPLMAGTIEEPVSYFERGMSMARIQGVDGWAYLRDQGNQVSIPLMQNVYAQDAIRTVLEAANWPALWGTNLAAGVDARPWFWVESQSPAQVIHDVAHNELGNVFLAGDGKLVFRSRLTQETSALTLTDLDVMNVSKMSPSEVVRNVITVKSEPRTQQSTQTVWEIPGRLEVKPGERIDDVFAEFTYNGEAVPVLNPISPVAVTDFNATGSEDGTGTDYTANFSVRMYPFATKAQLTIRNNGPTTAWIYVRVRGAPVAPGNSVSFYARDEASVKQFGPRPFNLLIDQNVNVARQYRDLLANYLTQSKNYMIVDLMPEPDVLFAVDVGNIIHAKLDNYGIDLEYRVIRIAHQFQTVNGIVVQTRWWLEPFERLFSGVQLPVQVPFQLGAL